MDVQSATVQWLVAATFAKVCGATDPAAVVSQAAREWEESSQQWGTTFNPFDWVPAHIRRIQDLAEEQLKEEAKLAAQYAARGRPPQRF